MKLKDKILEIDKNYEDFEVATLGNYIPAKKIGNLIYISVHVSYTHLTLPTTPYV